MGNSGGVGVWGTDLTLMNPSYDTHVPRSYKKHLKILHHTTKLFMLASLGPSEQERIFRLGWINCASHAKLLRILGKTGLKHPKKSTKPNQATKQKTPTKPPPTENRTRRKAKLYLEGGNSQQQMKHLWGHLAWQILALRGKAHILHLWVAVTV